VCVVLAVGCGAVRHAAVTETAPVIKASLHAYEAETDLEIARAAAPAILKLVEGLLETAPDDRELLETAARGWDEYAFGFLEDDLESTPNDDRHADERQRLVVRASALYDRAFGFAARLLGSLDADLPRALAADPATLEKRLAGLPKDAVPGLLFGGLALASTANLNRSDPSRGVDLPKAIALLERSRALDPTYYFGGAQMVLGIVFCSTPKAAGGDPARGRTRFDEAIAVTRGNYLLPRVMQARACDVRTGDRSHFERALNDALAAPLAEDRHYRLANEIAKRRAGRYLAEAGKLFHE